MTELEKHETAMLARLEDGLAGTTRYGAPDRHRTPTVLFGLDGWTPSEVCRKLAERGVNAPAGSFYALECARALGLGDAGAVRAGIAPYTDESDVDRLLEAVGAVARRDAGH
jgi:selenocysteine lyase/cysteine desulfurase